jgi:hypothetical protein
MSRIALVHLTEFVEISRYFAVTKPWRRSSAPFRSPASRSTVATVNRRAARNDRRCPFPALPALGTMMSPKGR